MLARSLCVLFVACSSGSTPSPPATRHDAGKIKPEKSSKPDDALGALDFQVSEGNPDARAHFSRGLLALHSFWYDEASREFGAAIAADPKMNMAYWGAAMSLCKLLWGEDDVAGARAFLARMPDPDHVSPREQAWILALVELLTDEDVRTSRKKFAAAMEQLNQAYPDDESATFLAISLLSTIRPEDPSPTTVRNRAAALAAGVFKHNPKHPGAAHYLIHAYDTPELASLALPYAIAYAKIAPAAFHALHMPAHIFVRLGMWREAIASCQAAWDASVAAAKREHLSADHGDFHSLSWLVEMNFELGQRAASDAALATFANAVRGGLSHSSRVLFANEVTSYAMRTGEWQRMDELLSPLDAPATEDPAPARAGSGMAHCAPADPSSPVIVLEHQAIIHAHLWAAAMLHQPAGVEKLLGELDKVDATLHAFLVSTQSAKGVAKIVRANARLRTAMRARAKGDDRALLAVLRQSVEEDVESAGESNPTGFIVNEEIADALMRTKQPALAAAAYALVLAKHPGRARAMLGAQRAATK